MTFYGFDEHVQCGWANVMWQELSSGPHDQPFKKNLTVALQELSSYRAHCNGTGFVMVPPAVFAGNRLPMDWDAQLTAFERAVAPYFRSGGPAIGIFLGDEKLCGGVSLANYSTVLAHLRRALPHALLYGNECSDTSGRLGRIPIGLDLFSFDYYDAANEHGLAEVAKVSGCSC